MRKRCWRIAGWSALILLAVFAFCAYRLVWGKPFTINLLADRQEQITYDILSDQYQSGLAVRRYGVARGPRARHPQKRNPIVTGMNSSGCGEVSMRV
jgi:hypothetical protein